MAWTKKGLHLPKTLIVGAITAFVAASAPTHQAWACTTSILANMPIVMYDGVPIIGVNINGHDLPFLLDTGANMSIMTPKAAVSAGLGVDKREIMQVQGIIENQKNSWNYDADFQNLTIGALTMGPGTIHIADILNPNISSKIAGVIGADILSLHDLDLDIPDLTASIVQITGCAGNFVPWATPHDTIAGAWINNAESQLGIPASLNGTPIKTMLDTGASRSMISLQSALAGGTNESIIDNSSTSSVVDAAGTTITTKSSDLKNLVIGGETFPDVETNICNCTIPGADFQIGEDYISNRHIWLSYGTDQIFIIHPKPPN